MDSTPTRKLNTKTKFRTSYLVQNLGLARVDVAQNAADGRAQVVLASSRDRLLQSPLAPLTGLSLAFFGRPMPVVLVLTLLLVVIVIVLAVFFQERKHKISLFGLNAKKNSNNTLYLSSSSED